MSTFQSVDEAREYFRGDRFAEEAGIALESLEPVTCGMALTERHSNANGGVMGGAIFTLADFAFAVAVNNVHRPTVAQQVSINYLSPPRGCRLTAVARCVKDGRATCVYNVDVSDDTGRAVAQFVGTGYKL